MQNYFSNFLKQKNFFLSHKTKEINFRRKHLEELYQTVKKYEKEISSALYADLHKSAFESYSTEIGLVLSELRFHLKHLKKWAKPKKVPTHLANFKAVSKIYPEPYGVVLIIAPWNYPFLLLFQPLVSAIAAGNAVVLKTSPYVPNTARVMEKIIREVFPEEYVSFYNGGREVNQKLLDLPFDYIFFTGSPHLGKIVMEKAAKNLTPVTLELGGKSPAIVDKDANLEIAAKRIAWGKLINAGQTCVAPDYLFVHKQIKDALLKKIVCYFEKFYGKDPSTNKNYPKIVNEQNTERLKTLIASGTIYYGGKTDIKNRYVQPTILTDVDDNSAVMQQEIFGPVLPVLVFQDLEEVITYVNDHPKPLALYYFSEDKKKQEYILQRTSSGGACINDTLMHLLSHHLPFGGVGNSGMGRYHGKYGFDTFSNYRSVLFKSSKIDIQFRYMNGNEKILKIIKKILR